MYYQHSMELTITLFVAFLLCFVLSVASMFLVSFFGQDVFNGQIFVLTVMFTAAVLHYVGNVKSKK